NRVRHQLLQHIRSNVRERKQFGLAGAACTEVHADVGLARREADQRHVSLAPALVPVMYVPKPTMPAPHMAAGWPVILAIMATSVWQSSRRCPRQWRPGIL